MIKPNLPKNNITKAVVSCSISRSMEASLCKYGIKLLKLHGRMNSDNAVIHHPDLYMMHYSEDCVYFAKNICSLKGEVDFSFKQVDIELQQGRIYYPGDVFFNTVRLGNYLIGNKEYIHPIVIEKAVKDNITIINVKQGYTKCNLCIVDENSIITEDEGIAKKISDFGFDVLLLKSKMVKLRGYDYGFIGGASGKISKDKLAFFGDITKHPEYNRIYDFLYKKNVIPISLSDEPLADHGSLIPFE